MKKYILLVIGLLMIANNALAKSVFDKNNTEITIGEAYALIKGYYNDDTRGIIKFGDLISFMEGAKYFATVHNLAEEKIAKTRNLATEKEKNTQKCLDKPIMVFAEIIFDNFKTEKEDGNSLFAPSYLGELEKCFRKQ